MTEPHFLFALAAAIWAALGILAQYLDSHDEL